MKVLIIGGLGYLGYSMYQALKFKNCEVKIIDCNIYGKFNEQSINECKDDLYEINLFRNSVQVTIDEIKNSIGKFDCIINCFGPLDSELLTNAKLCNNYNLFKTNFKALCEQLLNLKCGYIYQVAPKAATDNQNEPEIINFVSSLYDENLVKRCYNVSCPDLYGISSSIDLSGFINDVFIQFAANKVYYIESGLYDVIHFSSLEQFVERFSTNVINKENKIIDFCSLNKIILLNVICNIFGPEQHQLQFDVTTTHSVEFSNYNRFNKQDNNHLNLFYNDFVGHFSKNPYAFLNDTYNNKKFIENVKIALQYEDVFK